MHVFLETERLILRRFTPEDVDHLLILDADPDVLRFTNPGWERAPRAVYESEILPRFLAYYDQGDDFGYWAAEEKSTGTFLGWFHFRPARDAPEEIELGYRLLPTGRGKGYATEGSRALIRRGFSRGVRKVVATALVENTASQRVMQRVGMTLEREFVYPGLNLAGVRYVLDREDGETSGP